MKIKNALVQKENITAPSYGYQRRQPSGIYIDHSSALSLVPVWAATRLIAETIGMLSFHLFQQVTEGSKTRRMDLWIDKMIRREPNPEMTAMTLREILQAHALLWGNGYAEIERDNANRPIAMWPMTPDRVTPGRMADTREPVYIYRDNAGIEHVLSATNVFHLKGLGYDGFQGYDVISVMSRALGTHTAADIFSGAFFGNGATMGGALVVKGAKPLSPETKEEIRKEIFQTHGGAYNAFTTGIFEGDWDWKSFGIDPAAAQLIEARRFTVNDIARMFRVPPHKLGDLERATFTNIEEQNIDWVVDGVLPWVTRWEQEADRKLLTPQLRQSGHFTRMNLSTLLRGKMEDRYKSYMVGRNWGWLSANDVREMEDMDPLPSKIGDTYIVPLNFQTAEQITEPKAKPAPPPGTGTDVTDPQQQPDQPTSAMRQLLHASAMKVLDREYQQIADIVGRPDFQARVRGVMVRAREYLRGEVGEIAKAMGELLGMPAERRIASVQRIGTMYHDRHLEAWLGGDQPNDPDKAAKADRIVDDFMQMITVGATAR